MCCRAAEQAGIRRLYGYRVFRDGRIRHVTEVHNVGELGVEVRIRSNPRAMPEQFSVSDLAVKRRMHNSALRIDLENDRHKWLGFRKGTLSMMP